MKCSYLQELLRNFLMRDMPELTLVNLFSKYGIRTPAVHEIRVGILFIAVL
jgi:hypothetical protein